MLYFEVDNSPPLSMNFEDLQGNIIKLSTLTTIKIVCKLMCHMDLPQILQLHMWTLATYSHIIDHVTPITLGEPAHTLAPQ
jgi:hypothetical protein